MKKLSNILVLAIVAVFVMAVSAMAMPILKLSDGSTTQEINDSDRDGVVIFNGSVGAFNLNVTTGLTKPLIGAADFPMMDLNSINVSSLSEGELTIEWTETDFTLPDTFGGFISEIGGTTSGMVTYEVYLDQNNESFGQGILLNSLGTFSGGAFSDSAITSINLSDPFSLTLVATIKHSEGDITSFNAGVAPAPVPEPATILLLGTGLLGIVAFGRKKFNKKA